MTFTYQQIKATENTAATEAQNAYAKLSLDDLMRTVRQSQEQYRELVTRIFEEHDWVCASYFDELLQQAYPKLDREVRRELAAEIESMIVTKCGRPESGSLQSEIISTEAQHDVAVQEIANRLSPEQLVELDHQVQKLFDRDELPPDYEERKNTLIAKWLVDRKLHLSRGAA